MADVVGTQTQNGNEQAAPPDEGPSFHERPHAKFLIAGAVLVVLGIAAFVWHYYSTRESTDDAQIDGHINPISPRVGGTVIAVDVSDNQDVTAGTILVQLDPKDFQVAVEKAQADLANATAAAQAARTGVPMTTTTTGSRVSTSQAQLEMAQAGLLAAQKQVAAARARHTAAQAQLAEAEANNTKAQHDLDRMKQLITKDEVSQQQYDTAVAAAAASQATVESARADVSEAEQAVQVAESHLVQARAGIDQARAELASAQTGPQQVAIERARASSADARVQEAQATLDQAELNLQYTTVRAPVSGQISKKTVELGQIVQPGQPLMAIVPLEDIWVTANFKETQLKDMRPGQRAIVSVDALGGRKFKGHVQSIAAATGEKFSLLPPENATGNYVKVVQRIPVKIVFEKGEDPHHLLRPGMSVEPTVITK